MGTVNLTSVPDGFGSRRECFKSFVWIVARICLLLHLLLENCEIKLSERWIPCLPKCGHGCGNTEISRYQVVLHQPDDLQLTGREHSCHFQTLKVLDNIG